FCTTEMNLKTSGGKGQLGSIIPDLFVDRLWNVFTVVPVQESDYEALIAQNGQIVTTDGRTPEKTSTGMTVTDTVFSFMFPERSGEDRNYIQQLINQKLVDDDFVKDVLAIDFTRPTYSPSRCALLDFAPTLDAAAITPDAVRNGFKT